VPVLPLAAAIIAGIFGRLITDRLSHIVTISSVTLSLILSALVFYDTLFGKSYDYQVYKWASIGGIEFEIGFMIDRLSASMLLVVNFVSLMVHIYTIAYMAGDSGYKRFFSYISLFTFAMHMLVMSNNFLQLFFGWEAVGLVSYLLIGFWFKKKSAVHANLKAFLVNRVGDLGFLIGIALIVVNLGTLNFSEMFASINILEGRTVTTTFGKVDLLSLIAICLFIGAMGKSAQVPLHVWLPDSMEGPTPISALIHAATMVTAGIFMVTRLSPLFELAEWALTVVLVLGGVTAFFMGLLGMFQNDIKRIIAYSTLSQLGYMTVALGCSAYSLAIFHLITHAFFKALLFLGAGSVIIGMHHEQDIRKMGGLKKYMPLTYLLMVVGSLSLMGIPFLSGYYSKDLILLSLDASDKTFSDVIYFLLNAGVAITAFYSVRLVLLVFHGKPRFDEAKLTPCESPKVVTFPLLCLAAPSILLGYFMLEPFVINNFLSEIINVRSQNDSVTPVVNSLASAFEFGLHGLFSKPVILIVIGSVSAYLIYRFYPAFSDKCANDKSYFFKTIREKYYFDHFYLNYLVRFATKTGESLYNWSERIIIDKFLVHGVVNVTKKTASFVRESQTGFVFHYAISMIVGIGLFLWWFIPAPGVK
jgi:NADH-quinone oxidoreductase subunit L